MVLYITEQEVKGLVDMNDSIEALEKAFGRWSDAASANLPRQRLPLAKRSLNVMAGALPGGDLFGYRGYTSAIRFNLLILMSLKQEAPLAFIECGWLSRTRTGAASGVATRHLARADAKTMALIGTGRISADQIRAVAAVRDLEWVKVFSRDAEKRAWFAGQMAEEFDFPILPAESVEACLEGADIVTTATNAREPVVLGKWLKPGVHVNGAGANDGKRRELDEAAVLKSDIVVVDHLEQAHIEAGLLMDMVRDGKLAWKDVAELGSVVEKAEPKRTGPDQITFFHSLGLAFEDVAFGALIYEKAVAAGIGRTV
ncbi:MAG: ornithine cyclodeaminase family protein [Rhodospirillales bacterium]